VENLEKVGELALRKAIEEADLVVIDEIGKMELYSDRMKQAILEALDSKKKVLGTIMKAPHSFADKIKGRKDVKLIEIKKRGQPEVVEELIQAISEAAGKD
jgi:nucleoside-triphosphatase THEP1